MIGALKDFAKRHWPALRLRAILFSVLLFAAVMPALSAIFLRVYENTLVRQTEAELIAQGAALAAAASAQWPGAAPRGPAVRGPDYYQPEALRIDLNATPILPERPAATRTAAPPDPAAIASAQRLAPIFDETSRTTLASIVLIDPRGVVLIGQEAGGSYAGLPEVRAALAGKPQTVLRKVGAYQPTYSFEWLSRASAVRIHHARPILVDGRIVGVILTSRSARALFRGVYQDRGKFIVGGLVILGVLLVLAGLVSRGVTRPIEGLSAAARSVAAGNGGIPPTPATAAIEIRDLYADFRVMAEAIERRSRYLREFAAAVSHEFKTPLAGILGAVELLQDHYTTMSEAERQRFLANISSDSARLSQLVTRLLDLARADMARPEAGVAVDALAAIRRAADASGFPVELQLPPAAPHVAVPAATIETVLAVLIDNARQAGATRLNLKAKAGADHIALHVADDGPGVPRADRERIFDVFFTGRRAEGGTGLGLPIARSLLAASNGAIQLSENGKGAQFDIILPAARET